MQQESKQAVESLSTRVGQLVLIRWVAIFGQSVTVMFVSVFCGPVPVWPISAAIGSSILFNTILSFGSGNLRRLSQRATVLHLGFDIAQVCLLIALTGGMENPFSIFVMGPVAVAAATLSGRHAAFISGAAVVGISIAALWHMQLPWIGPLLIVPPLYVIGIWMALVVGIASIAFFTWNMANERRRLHIAYEASRTALLREQKVAAVGGLAAMVAHELNTPLATICLVAQELVNQPILAEDSQDELRLLLSQAERCRDILARLSRRREQEVMLSGETVSVSTLVEMAAAPYRDGSVAVAVSASRSSDLLTEAFEPWVARSPEILHGLGCLIDNAVQFAETKVDIRTEWDADTLTVRIQDDGPGFPDHLLEHMGEPYISTRNQDGSHLGLGVFISNVLLTGVGADLAFTNISDHGGEVCVRWRMCDLLSMRQKDFPHG